MNVQHTAEIIAAAYIEALYFTDGGPDHPELEEAELSPEAVNHCAETVATFVRDNLQWCKTVDLAQLGHDLWLTRNKHGAGFWDRPHIYGESGAQSLTRYADSFGECWPYVGDDGLIYID